MAKEHQISHKQMRILRLRSDTLHREYKGKKLYKKDLEEYITRLSALVDRACKNSGFHSQPVLVNHRSGGVVGINEIEEKGNVKSRY